MPHRRWPTSISCCGTACPTAHEFIASFLELIRCRTRLEQIDDPGDTTTQGGPLIAQDLALEIVLAEGKVVVDLGEGVRRVVLI